MQKYYILIALFFTGLILNAQDGSLDPTFGEGDGIVTTNFEEMDNYINGLTELTDNKIILTAYTNGFDSDDEKNLIIRFLENGSIDASFANGGVFSELKANNIIRDVKASDNNSFIVVYSNGEEIYLKKFLADASIDNGFGQSGILYPMESGQGFRSFVISPENKIAVYGSEVADGFTNLIIKQFLPSGVLDTSFGVEGKKSYTIAESDSLATFNHRKMSNGSMLITYKIEENGVLQTYINRYLENGSLDNSFGSNGSTLVPIESEYFCSCTVFSNNEILVGCRYFDNEDFFMIRKTIKLNATGNLETSFGSGGFLDTVLSTSIFPNQRFLANNSSYGFEGGEFIAYNRYYATGYIDPGFETLTFPIDVGSSRILYLESGKILFAMNDIWYNANPYSRIHLARYNNSPLGIEENTFTNTQVYPNPSTGIFNFKAESLAEAIPYQITDVSGKVIKTGKLEASETTIDLSNTANGLYFLNAGGTSVKLVKE